MTIAGVECRLDRRCRLVVGRLPHTKANLRNAGAIMQREVKLICHIEISRSGMVNAINAEEKWSGRLRASMPAAFPN